MVSEFTQTIIDLGTILSALGILGVTVNKIHKFMNIQEGVIKDMKKVKEEQKLVYKGLSACLDGLEQLGCNHTVPQTKQDLDEWINEQAHD